MNAINEITELMSRLSDIQDNLRDSENNSGVLSMDIDKSRREVLMHHTLFVETFEMYDVICNEEDRKRLYPYRLVTEVEGVKFNTVLSAEYIVSLKETHEKHFNYIQKQLQLEQVS